MDVLPTQARALAALPGMRGRITYGQGLVWDEAYDILMELSVLEKVNDKRGEQQPKGQNVMAGWFNKLLQNGRSDGDAHMYTYVYICIYIYIMHILHAIPGETKNNGAHGGFGSLPVTCCFIGNIHSTPAIELLQGKRGDHGCQAGDIFTYTAISSVHAIIQFVCFRPLSIALSLSLSPSLLYTKAKARLNFVTGCPIQPHAAFDGFEELGATRTWHEIPRTIWEDPYTYTYQSVGHTHAWMSMH